jgi:hypothetical protein
LYNETGLLEDNPFEVLDAKGVGQLMKMTADSGRQTRPDISKLAFAANRADSRNRFASVIISSWIMSPVRRRAYLSPGWPQPMRNCWRKTTEFPNPLTMIVSFPD